MNENASCLLKPRRIGPILCITPRERHALQLLADGHTRNALRHLGTSASKIDSLLEELFAVMGVASEAEAIAAAHKRGLLSRAIDVHPVDHGQQNFSGAATADVLVQTLGR
jgi:DNA-binding CsgD family transcriptional regulator